MDPLTAMAASGMRARQEALDMIANNLANTATAGFKGDREFYNLYIAPAASAGRMPLVEKLWTDFRQGTLTATGNPLDLAISGRGFFVVAGPQGPLYTRNGSLKLTPTGELTSHDGLPVLSRDGRRIRLDPALPFEVDARGAVRQNGVEVAQLRLADFASSSSLEKRDAGYFQLVDPAARPREADGEIRQGHLEASNVGPAETAVRMITVMRQFEMLHRALQLGGEMNRRAVEEVAKTAA